MPLTFYTKLILITSVPLVAALLICARGLRFIWATRTQVHQGLRDVDRNSTRARPPRSKSRRSTFACRDRQREKVS